MAEKENIFETKPDTANISKVVGEYISLCVRFTHTFSSRFETFLKYVKENNVPSLKKEMEEVLGTEGDALSKGLRDLRLKFSRLSNVFEAQIKPLYVDLHNFIKQSHRQYLELKDMEDVKSSDLKKFDKVNKSIRRVYRILFTTHHPIVPEIEKRLSEINKTLAHGTRSYSIFKLRMKLKREYNAFLSEMLALLKRSRELISLLGTDYSALKSFARAKKLYDTDHIKSDLGALGHVINKLSKLRKDIVHLKKDLSSTKFKVHRSEKKYVKLEKLFDEFKSNYELFLRHNLAVSRAAQGLYDATKRLKETPPDELHKYEKLIYNKQNDLFKTLERLSKALDMYANIKVKSKVASSVFKTQAASNLSTAYDTLPDILNQLSEDVTNVKKGLYLLDKFHNRVLAFKVRRGEEKEHVLPTTIELLEARKKTLKSYKKLSYKRVNRIVKAKYKVLKSLSKREKLKPSLHKELLNEMVAMHKLIASSSVLGGVGSVALAIPRKTGIKELQKELKENEKIAKKSSKFLKLLLSIKKDTLKHMVMRRAGLLKRRATSYKELVEKLMSLGDVITDVSGTISDYKKRGEFQTPAERKEMAKKIKEEIIQPILQFQTLYIKVNKRSKKVISTSHNVAKETIRFMDNLMNLAKRSKEIIDIVEGEKTHPKNL